MSGYEKNSVSSLGGGKPGQFESGYGNTLVGGEVALNRKKLRKAFKGNHVAKANVKASCGPFRHAFNLGDPLSRRNMSCGGPNQVNDTNSSILTSNMADSVSSKDCGNVTHGVTPIEVKLKSGNLKFVSDSSLFTEFKHLEAINLNYNDKSGGGDQHNGSYSFLNSLRG